MALPPNYFTYPLIEIRGYEDDSVNPTEIINLVFKKTFGIPNSKPYRQYYDELYTTNSFINTFQNQQYSQFIPSAPPTDILQDTEFIPFYRDYSSVNYQQQRWYSEKYPYLVYYSTILTTNATVDYDYSFFIESTKGDIITRNSIPIFYGLNRSNFDFGTNYFNQTKIYNMDGTEEIYFGVPGYGNWIFDTDSGIITFYDTPSIGISRGSPPVITFWRYEGLIGNSGINNIVDY